MQPNHEPNSATFCAQRHFEDSPFDQPRSPLAVRRASFPARRSSTPRSSSFQAFQQHLFHFCPAQTPSALSRDESSWESLRKTRRRGGRRRRGPLRGSNPGKGAPPPVRRRFAAAAQRRPPLQPRRAPGSDGAFDSCRPCSRSHVSSCTVAVFSVKRASTA